MKTLVTLNQKTTSLDLVCAYCASPETVLPDAPVLTRETDVRVVRLPATGILEWGELLQLMASGADGVLVTGRVPAPQARKDVEERVHILQALLDFVGYGRERLRLAWVSAAEGPQYLEAVSTFADAIRVLGPNALFGRADKTSQTVLPGSRIWGTHAPVWLNTELRVLARELLRQGSVTGILAWSQSRDQIEPQLAENESDVRHIFAGGDGYPSLVPALLAARGRRVAVLLRPADLWAVEELIADGMLRREELLVIGQGIPASAAHVVLTPEHAQPRLGNDEMRAMEGWSLPDRADFWAAQFVNCVNCNSCREVCPFQCYASRVDGAASATACRSVDASTTVACHLTCALRLGDRCVLCESCSAACPQGVPLHLLHQKVAQELARL